MNRPEYSRALVYSGTPGHMALTRIEIPPLRPTEALVRVDGCTLCGSDLHSLHGRRQVPVPTILGHEIVGTIVEHGSRFPCVDMQSLPISIGDRVTWAIVANCGSCFYCQRGLEQKCENACKYGHMGFDSGRALSGGLAEYCILAQGTHAIKVPRNLPLEIITPASCSTATVMAAMSDLPSPFGDDSQIAIIGAGMLGLTACAIAKQRGWKRILVIDPVVSKLEVAKKFGATQTFTAEVWAAAPKANHRYGCDVALELSGDSAMILPAMESLRTGGDLILVGAVFPVPSVAIFPEKIVRGQISLRGVHNYRPKHLLEAVQFLENHGHEFPFCDLVSPWHDLDDVEALLQQESPAKHVRLGVRPSQGPIQQ